MSARSQEQDPTAPAILIDIGNTTTTVAAWQNNTLKSPVSVPTNHQHAFGEAIRAHSDAMPKGRFGAVVAGSVVLDALEKARGYFRDKFEQNLLVVGETVPLPIEVAVTDASALGVDRACAAAAAYEQLQAACVVIDFGSAVTVDLVDDDGTLLGGAILPGTAMQLHALHTGTAALPEVKAAIPELPYGRNTTEAIQVGVCRGMAGAARGLVEAYALHLNCWPHVVATGGDVQLLAPHCDFIDTLVDHLVLRGIGLAHTKYLEAMGV